MARHITMEDVLSEIKDEEYLFPRGDIVTICVLTLKNGRQVVGTVFGQSFDAELGKQAAHLKAVDEIWPLLVYHAHCEDEGTAG